MGHARGAPPDRSFGPRARVYQVLEEAICSKPHMNRHWDVPRDARGLCHEGRWVAYAATLLARRRTSSFAWSRSSSDAFVMRARVLLTNKSPAEAGLSRSPDDSRLLLVLLIRLVVAVLTTLTRLLGLLAGLLILPALLLTALAWVLRLLTRLLIVAARVLLGALVWIVHRLPRWCLCLTKVNAGERGTFRRARPGMARRSGKSWNECLVQFGVSSEALRGVHKSTVGTF